MLSSTQKAQFESVGYLVVEDLVDPAALNAIRIEYAALLDTLWSRWQAEGLVADAPKGGGFWDKLAVAVRSGFDWYQPFDISLPHENITQETPMHFGPAVFDLITHERILDLVEDLIGGEISSSPIQHVRIKPPQSALPPTEGRAHVSATDWHQDMGVTNEEADETTFITVWLAVTDATETNGCLQVAPGQWRDLLPHCPAGQVGIPASHVPQTAVPTPVRAGGVVIFSPHTPHCSLANHSDEFRWSFDLRYNISGQATGRSQFPEFVARSRSSPKSELNDWREWRGLWEEARNNLAQSPHMNQHGRWSSESAYCA